MDGRSVRRVNQCDRRSRIFFRIHTDVPRRLCCCRCGEQVVVSGRRVSASRVAAAGAAGGDLSVDNSERRLLQLQRCRGAGRVEETVDDRRQRVEIRRQKVVDVYLTSLVNTQVRVSKLILTKPSALNYTDMKYKNLNRLQWHRQGVRGGRGCGGGGGLTNRYSGNIYYNDP